MNDREYLGMRLSRHDFARLPAWIMESWPVTAPALLAGVHFLVVTRLGLSADEVVRFNKWGSAILQIVGGGMVLYSIDSNMGQFESDSLKARVLNYFKRFPVCRWVNGATLNAVEDPDSAFFSATNRAKFDQSTLEGRVAQLERELKSVRDELHDTAAGIRSELNTATEALEKRVQQTQATAARIESGLKQITRDGVGVQVFGVFLVIHGSVAGAFT